ncbi:MAG: hypothetical protein U1E10_09365, partial [Bdellovibrionales bacterium]|nr:hypothetical protein [Bdellovibrionales bacterium]
MISISILVGLLGLATVDVVSLHGLIEAGANYGPKTQVHERSRLFLYFLVSTRSLEGLLLAMTMLASGVAMSRLHGLTGWLTSSFGIILSIGVAAVLTNPAAIHFGAAEVSLGLLSGSALLAYLAPSPTRQENWLPIGALLLTTGLLFFLSTNEFRYELALVAMASGFFFGSMLFFFRKIAGPHWESTSLYFLAGMASLVIAGFSL